MADTYLIAVDSRVQTLSGSRGFSTLVRETISALETRFVVNSVTLLGPTETKEIDLGPIERLQLLAIKSDAPVDVSVSTDANDHWTSLSGSFYLRIFASTPVGGIKIRTVAGASVEIALAGTVL